MRHVAQAIARLTGVIALAGALGCAQPEPAPVEDRPAPGQPVQVEPDSDVYVVRESDTLYSVAWAHGRDWRAVARWNDIDAPFNIYPGQRLRMTPPEGDAEPEPRTVVAGPRWQWPASGEVVSPFPDDGGGKRGIGIGGSRGAEVRAAAAGEVVYSGSGLIGYGKLIIIKHADDFISAYGYNDKLLVEEGESVDAGQRIAEMGRNREDRPMLHFEIREGGRSVDPLTYLPGR